MERDVSAAAAKSIQWCLCVRLCEPTRLPRPWDSPGKNTGVGCHFLLQCMKVKSESEVTQSCPTPNDPMDCSLPGSSVHGIFQARALEWGATAFSEGCVWRLLKGYVKNLISGTKKRSQFIFFWCEIQVHIIWPFFKTDLSVFFFHISRRLLTNFHHSQYIYSLNVIQAANIFSQWDSVFGFI